ncbi:MAG: DinB family protein [Rudanella sp.]|nr:DinB family protein [Rudanella sp.]
MKLQETSIALFDQLIGVTSQLTPAEFARPLPLLLGSSVGKHLRHIIEFYDLALTAHQTGHLNYDRRVRQTALETTPKAAIDALHQMAVLMSLYETDRLLSLAASFSPDGSPDVLMSTTYFRELHYNIEHAVHHAAIIRIGLQQTFPDVLLPSHFGVSYATVQHENQLHNPRPVLLTHNHLDHVQLG